MIGTRIKPAELWEKFAVTIPKNAKLPEQPSSIRDGATYREALANAKVIIKEWIGTAIGPGQPILEPKGRLLFACITGSAGSHNDVALSSVEVRYTHR